MAEQTLVENDLHEKVTEIIDIFKLYPQVFPGGYYRFLKGRLYNKIDRNELIYKKGVVLTWTKYKRKTKISPNISILKGEIKVNQLVNKNQGNGMARKIFKDFLNKHKTTFYLDVKKDNIKAINFYKKNNFTVVGEKLFGKSQIPGLIMKRQCPITL
jgi:predicted acetyltransferase